MVVTSYTKFESNSSNISFLSSILTSLRSPFLTSQNISYSLFKSITMIVFDNRFLWQLFYSSPKIVSCSPRFFIDRSLSGSLLGSRISDQISDSFIYLLFKNWLITKDYLILTISEYFEIYKENNKIIMSKLNYKL